MASPIRKFDAHDTWFITSRCFQARMLMTPHSPLVREVAGGVLARAADRYRIELFAYAFLSNHFHLVIRAQGQVIADFMQYVLSNLARKLARLCKVHWSGRFWERRYSAEPILDEPALEKTVRYVVAHGVKEGLVARASDWEGLHCADQLTDEKPRTFRWYNWTKRWNARREPDAETTSRWAEKFSDTVSLKLAPLPQWEPLPPADRRALAARLVAEEEAKYDGMAVLGMAAVKEQGLEPPAQRKRSPRPWCHASSAEGHSSFRAEYAVFLEAFTAASRSWRRGVTDVEFPRGSFKPFVRTVVRIV